MNRGTEREREKERERYRQTKNETETEGERERERERNAPLNFGVSGCGPHHNAPRRADRDHSLQRLGARQCRTLPQVLLAQREVPGLHAQAAPHLSSDGHQTAAALSKA